jgi:hypothetical protein
MHCRDEARHFIQGCGNLGVGAGAGRLAQGDMQCRPVLGVVDGIATEHGVDGSR